MKVLFFLFLTIFASIAFGQDDNCSSIFQYGLYNTSKKQLDKSDYQEYRNSVCSTLQQMESSTVGKSGGFSISVPGFADFHNNKQYTHAEIKELKKAYCGEKIILS